MLPTIPSNATLEVDESFYKTADPQRYDIVLIKRAFNNASEQSPRSMDVVSRIVGLPGEKIALRGGRVYINGKRIDERFSIVKCPEVDDETLPCGEMKPLLIPAGEYFLLADNRPDSEDSRLWSPHTIRRSEVIGKVTKIVRPKTAGQRALGADSP